MTIFMLGSLLSGWLVLNGPHQRQVNALSFSRPLTHKYRSSSLLPALPGADIEQDAKENEAPQVVGDKIIYRGKVNEIDYCIAPGDVSLSRASGKISEGDKDSQSAQTVSLTQALNNASNRAVRRILLAKSWPSEEDFNLSLRLAAAAETKAEKAREEDGNVSTSKCPVPRPILKLLTRSSSSSSGSNAVPAPASSTKTKTKPRTNVEYVADQIVAFRNRYGTLPEYNYAEAYLESILSLATTGEESPRVKEVLQSRVYFRSYKRILSVLKSGGVILEEMSDRKRFKIAKKLNDKNVCLSMIDTLRIRDEIANPTHTVEEAEEAETTIETVETESDAEESKPTEDEADVPTGKGKNIFKFWKKDKKDKTDESNGKQEPTPPEEESTNESANPVTKSGVTLCSDEPSMTRQLNAFSNIVRRALLFGCDQELLILSETLAGNDQSFVDRWYPDTGPPAKGMEDETRPGVRYLNALISLLREAYKEGIVTNLEPLTPLNQSYSNSYERLVASLVEDGSGYIRADADVMAMPKPRTATEELGRFAVWESAFRSKDEATSYPDDLEGTWEVKDEVGGETIGVSTVNLLPNGEVSVAAPLQGLRWRLDPGPTHLDTCTFQVLSEDGTVLQYRGFIDRGARLESRFSGRPIRIRGSVMFQMRYIGGGPDYWKEMLPVNYMEGTTKFEMKKKVAV
mmetsp:Transcript_31743/g.74709  ORF Transcript_31743/g.74709 Transcript_31743/m.74709 type:complete len:687 (-) Transcript_31743:264-2324(-)